MPTNFLNFFAVVDSKQLVLSATSLETFTPQFLQGESPPVGFTLLTRNPTGGFTAPWTKFNPAAYSLKLGLFLTSDGTQLAFQDTWTNNAADGSKYAIFTFNSVAISTALGAAASIACTFEAEYKDSAGSPGKIQIPVTLQKQFITPASATVAAGEVAATVAFTKQIAFPRDGSNPGNQCDGFIVLSRPSAIPILVYWDDAGVPHGEPQG